MDKRTVHWSLRSIHDKLEIYAYWTERNKSIGYAKKLEVLFNEIMELACLHPLSGVRTEIEGVRYHTVRNFKLIYRISHSKIEVITVWDDTRDPKKLRVV